MTEFLLSKCDSGLTRMALLKARQSCRIVNTEGGQVVDTWAFCVDEYLSMAHSRSANDTLLFKPGEQLFSNRFLREGAEEKQGCKAVA